MKLILYILIFISIQKQVFSQINFVQNPSFEDTVLCPTNSAQIAQAQGWWSGSETPDYFNSCAPNPNYSTPFNWGGYQQPASGVAYSAIGTYAPSSPNVREVIMSQLTNTLSVGTKYYVSFKACLSISPIIEATIATNKLGVKFSKNIFNSTSYLPINNVAHVYNNTIITDSVNWTLVKGSFIADSNYKYIMIGNFFDGANTSTYTFTNTPFNISYYFIDDVCVSTDSMLCMIPNSINSLSSKKSKVIYPNPTRGNIVVRVQNGSIIKKLSISDYQGQNVFVVSFPENNSIDLSSLSDGIYLIEIFTEEKIYYDKIIVQH